MGGRISWLLLPLLGGLLLLGGGAWLLYEGAERSRVSGAVRERQAELRTEPPAEPIVLTLAEPVPEVPLPAESRSREELASEPAPRTSADASVIAGRVIWPDGTPAEAMVRLVGGAAAGLDTNDVWMWTNTNGHFRFIGLPSGSCDVHAKSWRIEQVEPDHFEKLAWTIHRSGVAAGTTGLVLVLDPGLRQTGRIVDSSGQPLAGSVFGRGPSLAGVSEHVVADANSAGEFTIQSLAPGRWEFVAQCRGFLATRREADVPSTEPLVFVLEHGASIRGVVLDERSTPLPKARVMATAYGLRQGDLAESDAQGEFELVGLSAGNLRLFASVEGYVSDLRLELTLALGEQRTGVVLQMPACGRVTGTLSEASGRPLMDQPVSLSYLRESSTSAPDEGGPFAVGLGTTRSDAQGHFEFAGVAVGEYEVRVGMLSGLELASSVTVRVGETSVVELRAPARSLRLSGQVWIEGELAPDASVTAVRRDTRQQIARVTSDAQWNYALELPGAGEYWIGLWSERLGANQWIPLTLPSVAAVERDLELRLGQVSGTVWDVDGQRLAGLWVVAEQSSGHELGSCFGRALSDTDGDFELLLPPGTYALRVREAEGAGEATALAPAAMEEVVIAAGGRIANLDLVLTRGATLEGSMRRSDGSAIFGAKLWIGPTGTPVEADLLGESSRLGRFRISGVPAGSWWVTASEGDSQAKWQRVELESGATKKLEFVLE